MLKIKIALSVIVLASFITFVSCSEDEKSQIEQNEQTTSENLKEFVEEYVNISTVVINKMSKNSKIDRILLSNLLRSVKNRTDLEIALKKAGVTNYAEITNLLFGIGVKYENFVKNNPSFKILTSNDKQNLLAEEVENVFETNTLKKTNKAGLSNKSMARPCIQTYNIEVDRCDRDATICGTSAFVGALIAGPGYAGALAASLTGCLVVKVYCNSDAKDDYYYCIGG